MRTRQAYDDSFLKEKRQQIHRETGFSSELRSEKEFRLAAKGDLPRLRLEYIKRIKCFIKFMPSDQDRLRAYRTIINLSRIDI